MQILKKLKDIPKVVTKITAPVFPTQNHNTKNKTQKSSSKLISTFLYTNKN